MARRKKDELSDKSDDNKVIDKENKVSDEPPKKRKPRKRKEDEKAKEVEFVHPLSIPKPLHITYAHVKLRSGDKAFVAFRNDTIREFASNTLDMCVKCGKHDKLPNKVYFWEYGVHNLQELGNQEFIYPNGEPENQ